MCGQTPGVLNEIERFCSTRDARMRAQSSELVYESTDASLEAPP